MRPAGWRLEDKMDGNELIQAIQTLNTDDAFRPRLDPQQWRTFAQYLTRHELRSGDLLIKQGDRERAVYFLGQGSLQVFVTGRPRARRASPSCGRVPCVASRRCLPMCRVRPTSRP